MLCIFFRIDRESWRFYLESSLLKVLDPLNRRVCILLEFGALLNLVATFVKVITWKYHVKSRYPPQSRCTYLDTLPLSALTLHLEIFDQTMEIRRHQFKILNACGIRGFENSSSHNLISRAFSKDLVLGKGSLVIKLRASATKNIEIFIQMPYDHWWKGAFWRLMENCLKFFYKLHKQHRFEELPFEALLLLLLALPPHNLNF